MPAAGSVSSLYSDDEVELLLDEIRELEPAGRRAEEDFEIAGSLGARSPTERSWDSHAGYRRAPVRPAPPLAALYWRPAHLLSAAGALRLALLGACCGACGCVWALVGVRAWLLPLAPRVRRALLAALGSALVHALLLALHVTRLTAAWPLPWRRVSLGASALSAAGLAGGGAGLLHAVLAAPEYAAAGGAVRAALLAAGGLCAAGAGLAGALLLAEALWPPRDRL